ncbi:MAG: sporulation stage IV protein A, partial [Eubacteriales bacterium]
DLVKYMLREFEDNPERIWESNMFGKSLYELINEGLHTKLEHMPGESRAKLSETLERIINEGSSGLICIIL